VSVRRRGRPRADRLVLAERVADLLRAEPGISANEAQRRLRARRADVQRVIRLLRAAGPRDDDSAVSPLAGAATRFPYSETGCFG
jgi:hypothetical protein